MKLQRIAVNLAVSSVIFGLLSAAAYAGEPNWIWVSENANVEAPAEQVWFRKTFEIAEPESGQIEITADNSYILFVNGRRVGACNVWNAPTKYLINDLLKPGKNVLAVTAANEAVGPAGLAAEVTITSTDGKVHSLSTDASWRFSLSDTPKWRSTDFDDSGWQPVIVLGKYPDTAPWQGGLDRSQIKTVAAKAGDTRTLGSFAFQNGDRITLLGGTSIERMQNFGYFETFVTSTYPNWNLQFRNLGWSGDDVFGIARAVFGSQADGFRRLEQDLIATDPTVILICYGGNESFAGASGVPRFLEGLTNLVDVLQETGARLVLISPSQLENLGAPLPDPTKQNERLRLYGAFIEEFAVERSIAFIDFYAPLENEAVSRAVRPEIHDRLTDNGMHWNAYGYWRTGMKLAGKLGVTRSGWNLMVDVQEKSYDATGTLVSKFEISEAVEFIATDDRLPFCSPPAGSPRGAELVAPHDRIQITGLAAGYWGLQINDRPTVLATAEQWAAGVFINRGVYLDQSERLREAIRLKNELYFYRYRPENETYLFLFRKHEQGNNAVEVPQFDKLVADKEQEIEQLKKPVAHKYRLVPVEKPESESDADEEPDDGPKEKPKIKTEN